MRPSSAKAIALLPLRLASLSGPFAALVARSIWHASLLARLALLGFLAYPLAANPVFTLTDLGTPGGAHSMAFGVSPAGWVTGAAMTPDGRWQAYVDRGSSGMVDLGATCGVCVESRAAGANRSGVVAGTAYLLSGAQAAVWTGSGAPQLLGTLGGGESWAVAINAGGAVAGTAQTAGGQGQAFLYRNGVLEGLGTFAGGTWSTGMALNDAGVVAGYGDIAPGVSRGFVRGAGGLAPIGTFGGANSYALAINNKGAVAGHAQDAAGYLRAFLFENGQMTALGSLGGLASFAYGINSLGWVVGSALRADGTEAAFLWKDGILLDLNSLVPSLGDWRLAAAQAINDQGQIAGWGWYQGQMRAFRLDPATGGLESAPAREAMLENPEPASAVLAGISLILLVYLRQRQLRAGSR
jgi:probable HAF family extracellular repeat protein